MQNLGVILRFKPAFALVRPWLRLAQGTRAHGQASPCSPPAE